MDTQQHVYTCNTNTTNECEHGETTDYGNKSAY